MMVFHSQDRSGTTAVTENEEAVGLDIGLTSFIIDSVGRDGTACSTYRVETSTSHIIDARFLR
jgi:hypothetical protein